MAGDSSQDHLRVLREAVKAALIAKTQGTSLQAYQNLVREISQLRRKYESRRDAQTEFGLLSMIRALSSNITYLRERKHETLVSEVLAIKLWSCSKELRQALLELQTNLMVANSTFMHTSLQIMVFSLLPPPGPPPGPTAGERWQPSPEALAVQEEVLQELIRAMALVPTLASALLPLLQQNMPHKVRDRDTQCMFLRAALHLAESPAGLPIREALLVGVVEHLLTIDVEIRWEDIVDVATGQEFEEGSSEEEQEDIFELEGMMGGALALGGAQQAQQQAQQQALGGFEGSAAAAPADASGSGRAPVDETANKLDSMMELLFQHLKRRCGRGELAAVWATLLGTMERTILHTHRSKFTQFLLFQLASKDPAGCGQALVAMLLAKLRDGRQPPITRCASAAYLTSFLARCSRLPEQGVLAALQQLADCCHSYASSALQYVAPTYGAGAGAAPGPEDLVQRHQVFYAMFQGLLYVLCYHMNGCMAKGSSSPEAQAVSHLVRERVAPLLGHSLSPLAACLPSVANEFSHQTDSLGLLRAADIARYMQQQASSSSSSSSRPQRPLEMFFPFDPYLLRRSSCHLDLKQSYRRWRHGHPEVAEAAEADDADDSSDEDVGDASGEESDDDSSSDTSEARDLAGASMESGGAGALGLPPLSRGVSRQAHKARMPRVSSGVLRPRPIGQAMMERALGVSQSPDVMMMGMSPAGHGVSPMAMSITPDGFMPGSLPQVLGRS